MKHSATLVGLLPTPALSSPMGRAAHLTWTEPRGDRVRPQERWGGRVLVPVSNSFYFSLYFFPVLHFKFVAFN
jgi:hypothetical protein